MRIQEHLLTKPSTSQYSAPLDGLRALRALAVFALHATGERIAGGFLGVDVFFVLSGHLISGLLCDEYDRAGTIDFGRFYVRRGATPPPRDDRDARLRGAGPASCPFYMGRYSDSERGALAVRRTSCAVGAI